MSIKKKKVAFLYPGQGAQMPGMGLDLNRTVQLQQ